MTELKKNSNLLTKTLDWAYEKAINPAIELAESYLKEGGDINKQVDKLIRSQVVKTSATGFVTGLGGLVTLPISLPADIAGTIYIQTKMIAAIAHMGGCDIRDKKVKTMVLICLVGDTLKDAVTEIGVDIGVNVARKSLSKLPGKMGGRLLPIVGGIIGGTINGVTTHSIGLIAKKMFIGKMQ
jgi:hypothetical protein